MLDKLIVVTQQKISFFGLNENGDAIRDYLQGEESQDITYQPGESLTRVLDYVQEAQLLHGCNMVRVLYDEELDTVVLNSLVDFIKAKVKSYEVIQFKTLLPELLLKSASTEINSPVHVQLCDIAFRIDIDDTILKIKRQNDPESPTDFVWNDENLVRLTINDSYPTLNACKTEEIIARNQSLEKKIVLVTQENRTLSDDLKKSKHDLVLKTTALAACLKELAVFKDKNQKEQKRMVFKAFDIPRLADYLRSESENMFIDFGSWPGSLPLIIERIVDTQKLVTMNQPIFRVTIDKSKYSKLGKYESVLKAGRSGRIYCFSKALGESKTGSLKYLFNKLRDNIDIQVDYNPVLFVIADENDTVDEIRQWCFEQGYDVYE